MALKYRILFRRNCGLTSTIINVIYNLIRIITTIGCNLAARYVNRFQ